MGIVFAGSDGSFITPWQAWKRRNKEYESFVIATDEVLVFRRTDDERTESYVWYYATDESNLPDGIEVDGLTVRGWRDN